LQLAEAKAEVDRQHQKMKADSELLQTAAAGLESENEILRGQVKLRSHKQAKNRIRFLHPSDFLANAMEKNRTDAKKPIRFFASFRFFGQCYGKKLDGQLRKFLSVRLIFFHSIGPKKSDGCKKTRSVFCLFV
jgi:hypothetical protein